MRPSPKHSHHHPLISRFHRTGDPHDPHSVRWSVPSELSLGVYHGVTILRLGGWGSSGPKAPRLTSLEGRQVLALWTRTQQAHRLKPNNIIPPIPHVHFLGGVQKSLSKKIQFPFSTLNSPFWYSPRIRFLTLPPPLVKMEQKISYRIKDTIV